MSVTFVGHSVTLTALNDEATGVFCINSINLVGTGMTAGERLTIKDSNGAIIGDHYIQAANENIEFEQAEDYYCRGIKLTAVPSGTWTVHVRFK